MCSEGALGPTDLPAFGGTRGIRGGMKSQEEGVSVKNQS